MTTLLFFGAGASRPFDIPTMQEMVSNFESILQAGSPEKTMYSKIKEILQRGYNYSNVDIESVFSVVQGIASGAKLRDMGHLALYYIMSNNITREFTYEEIQIAIKLQALLEGFIKEKCKSPLNITNKKKIYDQSFHALLDSLPGTKTGFASEIRYNSDWKAYTTNYDSIFEDFCADFLKLEDYFQPEGSSRNEVFFVNKQIRNNLTYIKLHGSLDWLKEKNNTKILKIGSTGFTRYKIEGEVMLFPIQQKDLYLHPWITLFQNLKSGLNLCETWVVIGYAFNDEFIFEIFKEALNASKKLVIINPSANEVKSKFPADLQACIIALPIRFGDEYFPLQIHDYFEGVRTLEVRIKTKSDIFGFQSSTPIRSIEVIGDKGPIRVGPMQGVNRIVLPGTVSHKNDLVKCTLKFSHEPPYDKELIFQYVTDQSYDVDIAVYLHDRFLTSLQTTKTKLEKVGEPCVSEPIKIAAHQLFVKT